MRAFTDEEVEAFLRERGLGQPSAGAATAAAPGYRAVDPDDETSTSEKPATTMSTCAPTSGRPGRPSRVPPPGRAQRASHRAARAAHAARLQDPFGLFRAGDDDHRGRFRSCRPACPITRRAGQGRFVFSPCRWLASHHRPADEPARRTAPTWSAPDRPRRPSRLHGDGAEQDRSRVRSVGSVNDERPPDRRQPKCGSTARAKGRRSRPASCTCVAGTRPRVQRSRAGRRLRRS